ncbi:MAG: rod shape-determining protein [Alphaproteobacteria bacterium]|nr:rod shape-determining protein [Alphaproteobacteria bacterium]MCZ6763968.1 rod shape-determining protein [Alphaproteobacteria bacterium]
MSSDKRLKLAGDLAIDLGTTNTRVYAKGEGCVIDEPSVVAVSRERGNIKVKAVGTEADKMFGRAPAGVEVIRPLRSGVVSDLDITSEMIRHFLRQACGRKFLSGPAVLISVASGSTPVERLLVKEAALTAGARKVTLIEGCLAAAIGAGLPVGDPSASMIVDIGGGTTDVAVLALGGIVYARSADIGGETMDAAIIDYVREVHNVLIGAATAEMAKREVGTAYRDEPGEGRTLALRGRDLAAGVPAEFMFSEAEVAQSLIDPITSIYEGIQLALEYTERDLGSDIEASGIWLAGGGACLRNLDLVIAKATGLPVHLTANPLACVVDGAGLALEKKIQLLVSVDG